MALLSSTSYSVTFSAICYYLRRDPMVDTHAGGIRTELSGRNPETRIRGFPIARFLEYPHRQGRRATQTDCNRSGKSTV